jgi:hypothetical protein
MAASDPVLQQRIVDALARVTEILRDFAERSGDDRREIRERCDEIIRMLQEERTVLAEQPHRIADDVTDAFSSAFATHRAISAAATAPAGGEPTGRHQLVPHEEIADVRGVRVPWAVIGKGLALVGAGFGGWLLEHFKLLH